MILTHDLGISVVVSTIGCAFLQVDSTPVAATWPPLGWLPALAWCGHDSTGVALGTGRQTILKPLAEHLTCRHARIPLTHNQEFGAELAALVIVSILFHQELCSNAGNHLPELQELLAGLKVGHCRCSVTQAHYLVKAFHAQVGSWGLQEWIKLEGLDLARCARFRWLGDLHVDSVATGVRVLQGPRAWGCRKCSFGWEDTKKAALLQCSTGSWGRSRWGGKSQVQKHTQSQREASEQERFPLHLLNCRGWMDWFAGLIWNSFSPLLCEG